MLKIWENLLTDVYGTHFHLFTALAILEAHRTIIMRYLQSFDEVLKYINELSSPSSLVISIERTLTICKSDHGSGAYALSGRDSLPHLPGYHGAARQTVGVLARLESWIGRLLPQEQEASGRGIAC